MQESKRPENRKKQSYTGIIVLMIIMMAAISLSVVRLLLPEQDGAVKKAMPSATVSPVPVNSGAEGELTILAIVLSVDTDIKTMTLHEAEEGEVYTVVYAGSSVFSDRFEKPMAAAQLRPGDMLFFSLDKNKMLVTRAWEPNLTTAEEGVWEKKDVDQLEFFETENRITFDGQNYSYSSAICVMSNGERIQPEEVLPMDRVLVRGSRTRIYEIIVTRGHGYLSLVNHEDFVDGTITIGVQSEQTITEEAVYLLKEGVYRVTVSHGRFTGTETLEVERDQTTVFDVFAYGDGPTKKGGIRFYIEPMGATLYINGEKTPYYGEEIILPYGVYFIEAAAGGYITYEASVEIKNEKQQLSIYLTEKAAEPEEPQDDTQEPQDDTQEP